MHPFPLFLGFHGTRGLPRAALHYHRSSLLRYRQSRGRSLCPRMEATAALRSHPPATGSPLSVAWLHVCGVCVSVPGQGRCQRWACHSPRRGSWGLGTRGTRESSLSPGTPLAQSVVLETGPQPQYCHLCTHPRKSPGSCPPQKLPTRAKLCQLWSRAPHPA